MEWTRSWTSKSTTNSTNCQTNIYLEPHMKYRVWLLERRFIRKYLHNFRRITVTLSHLSWKSQHFSDLLSHAATAPQTRQVLRGRYITFRCSRTLQTTTVHCCVNHSEKPLHHSMKSSHHSGRKISNFQQGTWQQRQQRKEDGEHHMSSCWADITVFFYTQSIISETTE